MVTVPVVIRDKVDGNAEVSKTSRTADAVKICLGMFRKVEVDNNVDGLNVYAASEQVCIEQQAACCRCHNSTSLLINYCNDRL